MGVCFVHGPEATSYDSSQRAIVAGVLLSPQAGCRAAPRRKRPGRSMGQTFQKPAQGPVSSLRPGLPNLPLPLGQPYGLSYGMRCWASPSLPCRRTMMHVRGRANRHYPATRGKLGDVDIPASRGDTHDAG